MNITYKSTIFQLKIYIYTHIISLLLLLSHIIQLCPTLCNPIDSSPPGSSVPGILDKNTGVGCHFLLQCMKVKSEREVAQCDPMDCSLPGTSVHRIFQARVYRSTKIAEMQTTNTTKCWQGCGAKELCQIVQPLRNTVFPFFRKLNIGLPDNTAISLLRIHSNKLSIYIHTKISTRMFLTALFIMPKLRSNQDTLP